MTVSSFATIKSDTVIKRQLNSGPWVHIGNSLENILNIGKTTIHIVGREQN